LFRNRCQEVGAPLYQGGIDFKTRGKSRGSFNYFGLDRQISGLTLNLRGRHQYGNAAVALAVVENQAKQFSCRGGHSEVLAARWPAVWNWTPPHLLDGPTTPGRPDSGPESETDLGPGRLIMVMGVGHKDVDTI
jgi:folylpolyglutamate synthase/dihydropteroate synthase